MITIFEYAKLKQDEQQALINGQALFIDSYVTGGLKVFVYFLNSFFIEVTTKGDELIDIIPYKRGYKIEKMTTKPKLLLVDDDSQNLQKMETMFESHFMVNAVTSGVEALRAIEKCKYDVVVTDINLNNHLLDGLTVMRTIKGCYKHSKTKVFALSNYSGLRSWYIKQGFEDLFVKSNLNETVIDVIKETLIQKKISKHLPN